jgi:hypothetical protein
MQDHPRPNRWMRTGHEIAHRSDHVKSKNRAPTRKGRLNGLIQWTTFRHAKEQADLTQKDRDDFRRLTKLLAESYGRIREKR